LYTFHNEYLSSVVAVKAFYDKQQVINKSRQRAKQEQAFAPQWSEA
jgi:hypothetical protein